MKIISVETMRRLEGGAIRGGVPGDELMRRAGNGAAGIINRFARGRFRRVVLLGGSGNNCGDALVAATGLELPAVVYAMRPLSELRNEARIAARNLPESVPVKVFDTLSERDFAPGDLIVDGLLGIGFSGELRPRYAAWIDVVNRSGQPVIALDLPSGLNADTGRVGPGGAIRAAMTITFGYPKRGMFLAEGPRCTGPIRLVEIGLEAPDAAEPAEAYFFTDAASAWPRPANDVHKNRRGRLLVAAGSASYSGAAVLASRAALRTGAGIVRMVVPATPLAAVPAALIVSRVADESGCFGPASLPELRRQLAASDAVVAGPGWGTGAGLGDVLSELFAFSGPLLLDADALNVAAREPQRWNMRDNLVLTPHPGEAARLAAAFGIPTGADRGEFAANLAARLGAVVVLKGPQSVVAAPDGRRSFNTSGSAALATAGSGDVLSGTIGALLAGGALPAYEAARLGVFLHGLAGEQGGAGTIADDLPDRYPALLDALGTGFPGA